MDDDGDNNGATDNDDNISRNGTTEDNGDSGTDEDGNDNGKGDGATDNNGDNVSGNYDDGNVQQVTTTTTMAMHDNNSDGVMDGQ